MPHLLNLEPPRLLFVIHPLGNGPFVILRTFMSGHLITLITIEVIAQLQSKPLDPGSGLLDTPTKVLGLRSCDAQQSWRHPKTQGELRLHNVLSIWRR